MKDYYILGDWGTSSARFYLFKEGKIVDSVKGTGIKFCKSPKDAFHKTVEPWIKSHGSLTSVLCGMVGANIGWREAGYCPCPAGASDLAAQLTSFSTEHGVVNIVPGVKTMESLTGLPDVMRGEETQIFGWAKAQSNDGMLCLPGTHTKWVQFRDGKICNFVSSMNGELFNILKDHSVLIGAETLPDATIGDEFRRGVKTGSSGISLNQLLFSVRALQLEGEYDKVQAKSYLLGLLIGSDVKDGLNYFSDQDLSIIGGLAPSSFYAEAIRHLGGNANIYDGQEASLQGLQAIHNEIYLAK